MNRIILVTRPKYDDGTEYLSYYASLILKKADELEISNKDFEGKDANSDKVTKFIEKQDPKLLVINGHGDENSIDGHREVLFSVNKNLEFLKGRITFARACHSAVNLGKEAVKNNDGCFIGYVSPFSFWINEKWSAKPSNDKTAALFLEPSNKIVESIIDGFSTEKAEEKSRKMMIENMKKILKMEEKKEPEAMGLLQVLWNNFDGQVLLGNGSAVF